MGCLGIDKNKGFCICTMGAITINNNVDCEGYGPANRLVGVRCWPLPAPLAATRGGDDGGCVKGER